MQRWNSSFYKALLFGIHSKYEIRLRCQPALKLRRTMTANVHPARCHKFYSNRIRSMTYESLCSGRADQDGRDLTR